MELKDKLKRILWFSNTPGLGQNYLKVKVFGEGWISALQSAVEGSGACTLGYVFYSDQKMDPFEFNKTRYFPVQKIANTKNKRFLYRLIGKTEYDENIPEFLRIIENFKPDLIHIQGTENPFGLILNKISHVPVVISIQGNLTAYTSKYFTGMKMPGLWAQIRAGYPYPSMDFALWQKRVRTEQEILDKAKYVFGRTDWDRRICKVLAPSARYYHLEELLRPKFYEHKWQTPDNSIPVFFTTSSGSFYKGFETIIETAEILTKNKFPFTWMVAGLSESDSLVKLILKEKKISNLRDIHIQLIGRQSEDELIKNMLHADIYVQVSHIENSPNSLCEAMLLGMPIVASFAGGTSTLVEDKVSGILVQDGDPYSLAGSLIELVHSPQMARKMGEQAYLLSHKKHDGREILSTLLKTYTEIIDEHQVAGGPPAPNS